MDKQQSEFEVIMSAVRIATNAYVERVRVIRESMKFPVEAFANELRGAADRFNAQLKQLRLK